MFKSSQNLAFALSDRIFTESGCSSSKSPKMKTQNPIKMLKVNVTRMNDLDFKKDLFNPLKTGRKIDEFFSGEKGIMPGTNTVITGDPGIGKTTVLLDIIADLNNKGKKVLFVSGEMNQIDMVGYVKRFPKFGDLPILFMGDYADEDPLEVLATAFEPGYDVVLIDSLAEVAVAIQDYHGGTYKGATSKILTLLEEQNMGENKRGVNTASLLIQQVTKSGAFAGSNRIKHMTTAMGHLKFDGEGGRYLMFTKNRRGGNMNKFYFNLNARNMVNWLYEAPANQGAEA
jgi:predicted ATP-dependent serine protease